MFDLSVEIKWMCEKKFKIAISRKLFFVFWANFDERQVESVPSPSKSEILGSIY